MINQRPKLSSAKYRQSDNEIWAPFTFSKVGSSNGLISGPLTAYCRNAKVLGSTSKMYLCQHLTKGKQTAGDSGAPVFRVINGSDVKLYGIAWGADSTNTNFAWSDYPALEFELGFLHSEHSNW